jgi:hydrogenase/urease accessory protein HupE
MLPIGQTLFALLIATISPVAWAHEGHGNSLLHAFLHLLQEPDHLLLLSGVAGVVLAIWFFYKRGMK